MDVRQGIHPEHGKSLDTAGLRREFLIEELFVAGEIRLTYSHVDRVIAGGICPAGKPLALEGGKLLASDSFLERRELGFINIGGAGSVRLDGESHEINPRDGMYVGRGVRDISFSSADLARPAKYWTVSAPAHRDFPAKRISQDEARVVALGSRSESNKRVIRQYVHPDVVESCQLAMGLTTLDPENVWNTMPCHTHERRMEVYFYFGMPEEARVFHLMGRPEETRHIVVGNEQAVISPSWSLHSGVGTAAYSFIWAMAGENQEFTDMDAVPMAMLR